MIEIDKCCITRYPVKVLSQKAQPIETINDNIRLLADKMIDIMIEQKGVGLAGPQAGVNLRIFVISVDGNRENAKVYINPKIEPTGPLETNEEGCLSIPGFYTNIKRHKQCTVTATDLYGNVFTEEGEGLLARAFQHEHDHLEGMMIKDRAGTVGQIKARKILRQLEEKFNGGD